MRENVDLRRFNTFGVPSVAEHYLPLTDSAQLSQPEFRQAPALVLGGGSNLLLLDRVPGLTVHVLLGGIEHSDDRGRFRVRAGTDWNQFVRYTLEAGFPGMENLILIPGTVGAAPVQNIGAYGAEVSEFITAVHAWEYGQGMVELSPADCAFGYRDSRFKQEPGRFLILAVDFDLSERRPLKLQYGAIAAELEAAGIGKPTPRDVANAVTRIRRSKLPDWFFYGNSGSFFKNPVVPRSQYASLQKDYPELPAYPIDDDSVKLPAGWLIDKSGLRGAGNDKVGTYDRQALVMVNRGGATGAEVQAFSCEIQATVAVRFGVDIEPEVQLIGEANG